jgi:two-component system response regulator
MENSVVEILLVEDNPDDAGLTIRALKKYNLVNNLHHVEDGEEAIDFIFSQSLTHLPKLILLDLKLPKIDGLAVLRKLKSDPEKKVIPVVILTSSKEEKDIIESYQLGVNAYIVKPVEFESFIKAVAELGLFWVVLNQSPKYL